MALWNRLGNINMRLNSDEEGVTNDEDDVVVVIIDNDGDKEPDAT